MVCIDRLKKILDEIDNKIGAITSDTDKRITKLLAQAELVEEEIRTLEG